MKGIISSKYRYIINVLPFAILSILFIKNYLQKYFRYDIIKAYGELTMKTVMEKCYSDMQALENLMTAFNNFYNYAVKNAYEAEKDLRVKIDMARMSNICNGMLERIKNISASI